MLMIHIYVCVVQMYNGTIKAKVLTTIRNRRTARDVAVQMKYLTAITADNKLAQFQFQQDVMQNLSLKYVEPDSFLVFSSFDVASKGDNVFVTMTESTKV